MVLFKSKIDKLSKKRQTLLAKRDNAERAMRERNSKREAKSQALINRCVEDYEDTQRFMTKIDRQLDKLAREINSEKIYVEEVASSETKEYLNEKAQRAALKKVDGPFYDPKAETKTEPKPKTTNKKGE